MKQISYDDAMRLPVSQLDGGRDEIARKQKVREAIKIGRRLFVTDGELDWVGSDFGPYGTHVVVAVTT